jgi:hypothetical protein
VTSNGGASYPEIEQAGWKSLRSPCRRTTETIKGGGVVDGPPQPFRKFGSGCATLNRLSAMNPLEEVERYPRATNRKKTADAAMAKLK